MTDPNNPEIITESVRLKRTTEHTTERRAMRANPLWLLAFPAAVVLGLVASSMMSQAKLSELSSAQGWSTFTIYGKQNYQLDARLINRWCLEDAIKHPGQTRVENVVIEVPASRGLLSTQTTVELSQIEGASYAPVNSLDGRSGLNFGKAWGSCPSNISAVAPGRGQNTPPEPVKSEENVRPQIPAAPGKR